ncbi:MAG TPA: alginate export family protein [Gemmatimonadaceae bacterium]|nr:alginate export family protein [Gemmatimonadaceae bacterium]
MRRELLIACFIATPAVLCAQTNAGPSAHSSRPPGELPLGTTIGGQLRVRVESYDAAGFNGNNSDGYALTRVLLNARVHPTRSTAFFVEGMDARGPWKNKTPAGAPFRDFADLRQLYAQFGADNAATIVRAGRQELFYGDGRLVGPLLWANTARTFDAARMSTSGKGYRVDAFAASVVRIDQTRFDKNIPGNNFYGTYVSTTRLIPRTSLEPFFFWRRQSGLNTEAGVRSTMNFGTVGLRLAGKQSTVDYDAQVVGQRGSLGDEPIRAWAAHGSLGYTVANVALTPRLWGEYNEATGDSNPTDNRKETFDQLYPTGHDKYGLTDLVGWQNMRHVRGGLDVAFTKSWSATTRYNRYWLDDPHDALYNGGGAVLARSATGVAGTDVGQEVDFVVQGKPRNGLGFSAGIGHFVPGDFLKTTTPGHTYTYPYAMLTFDF